MHCPSLFRFRYLLWDYGWKAQIWYAKIMLISSIFSIEKINKKMLNVVFLLPGILKRWNTGSTALTSLSDRSWAPASSAKCMKEFTKTLYVYHFYKHVVRLWSLQTHCTFTIFNKHIVRFRSLQTRCTFIIFTNTLYVWVRVIKKSQLLK